MLPFSREAFFAVFASYNAAVWPAQVFLYGLALALAALTPCGRWRNRVHRGTGAPVHHNLTA